MCFSGAALQTAGVKDIIFKLQEPVGKAQRAPFLDQFREEGPQPASGGVLNGHNGTGGKGKKKKLNGCTVDFICCLCLRCLSAAEPWKAKEVVGIPQGARPCLFAWHGPLTCTAGRSAWEAKAPITHRSLFIQACEDLDSLRVTHVKQDQRSVRFKAARGFVQWKCVPTVCQCRCRQDGGSGAYLYEQRNLRRLGQIWQLGRHVMRLAGALRRQGVAALTSTLHLAWQQSLLVRG